MRGERGFTVVETLVAVVVLTLGLLGLLATTSVVTSMNTRGQRTEGAARFAAQRAERLRLTGCGSQAAGSESLVRNGAVVATNTWAFTDAGNNTWRVLVTTTYPTVLNHSRVDRQEIEIPCRF